MNGLVDAEEEELKIKLEPNGMVEVGIVVVVKLLNVYVALVR